MLEVLGDLRVIDGGESVVLRSRLQRRLITALVRDRGSPSSPDRLAESVWGDQLPGNSTASLQSHISRLRALLPDWIAIETTGGSYHLVVDDDDLDVAIFERCWATARSGPAHERLAVLDEALALWRGDPYADLDDDRSVAEASRLSEVHLDMRERRAQTLIELGRASEAVAGLETIRRDHPLRESTAALTMRALVAAGRTPDALRVYGDLRRRLADDLGLDPSPELRELEVAILREELVAPPVPALPEWAPLPLPTSSLHGRDEDVGRLVELVRTHRVVTLTGPGGVGKTRLGLHVAHRVADELPDGAALVELAEVTDPDDLVEMVASSLGVTARAESPLTQRIAEVLRPRHMLLMLDNCEHLVDEAAAVVEALVRSTRSVNVLATSRERLDVDGEHCWPVRPLTAGGRNGAATELFRARARAVRPDLVLDARNDPLVATICQRLDGLPLAIELAAARLTTLSLAEIADGLDHRFALLDRSRRTAAPRHRSLWDVVDWSYRQLDPEQTVAFVDLSVFAGTFTLDAARAVCRPGVAADVAELVERSLLVAYAAPAGGTRYGFLETVRAFARERLEESGRAGPTYDRHARWALHLAEELGDALIDEREAGAHARLLAAVPELRAAHHHLLARGDHDRAFRLSAALHAWAWPRMQSEVLGWAESAASQFAGVDHPLASLVLASAATSAWQRGDLATARWFVDASQTAATSARGAGRGAAESAGDVALLEGRLDVACARYEEALDQSLVAGDVCRQVVNLGNLILAHGYSERAAEAARWSERARAMLEAHPAPTLRAWIGYCEGEAAAGREPERALALLEGALVDAEVAGARFVTGVAGLTWLTTRARTGDPRSALAELTALLRQWHRAGLWTQEWTALRAVVELLARLGDHRGAARLLGALEATATAAPVFGPDADRLAAVRTELRDALGADLEDELDRGRHLNDDEAVAAALARLDALRPRPGQASDSGLTEG